ncbi:Threonine--tRNA ligase [Buchnera aphidicola (Cinara kochiana kochiana)]|uniref:Threonine--tRNA ligase n=1 Tax=Buchnera aphidicola (Cinara kochiana kochiana) TaxID=2518976 RepID=A0A451D5E1_9GAMM|nr:threonine--tRNA ligase [Buchnera aphidicola]VFP81003.1 Threonine--tRNA ligase [Buchnera aphidicola (Cinara kochiana kochiana)]
MPIIVSCNGVNKIYANAVTLQDISKDIFPKHNLNFIAGLINNQLVSLDTLIHHDADIVMINENDKTFIRQVRRSCMQLLNRVLQYIWPDAKIAGGSITESGFYCDVDMSYVLTKKDLDKISKKMLDKIFSSYNIYVKSIIVSDFLDYLNKKGEIYQINIIQKQFINKNIIDVCYHEDYCEFYNHSQVSNIKFCQYFLLKDISGAYWNNDKNNKMLQRIHVIAWVSKNQLLDFINKSKELEKRDHRKIAKLLNLYHIQKESPGMIFWHNNGYIIVRQLKKFIRTYLIKNNYLEVNSPIIIDKSLWKKSGHWKYYHSSIFVTKSENREYCIKPMNCPAHVLIFKNGLKSYKDLPIRIAEFGSCHRQESSGALHGLMRVRGFIQDDAHIFCRKKQIQLELHHCINLLFDLYKTFGFKKITINFSTRPKNRIGDDEIWNQAEKDLETVLKKNSLPFQYQLGEGAFYGPKIEISLEDNLQRIWQCGTIQLDFYLAKQLGAFYINKKGIKKYPIIIHRALLGSLERFIGILIEEYNGKLPLWLCPIQVVVLSITNLHVLFVQQIIQKLLTYNIRAISDITDNSLKFKIHSYIKQKIPYILVCGDKEIKCNYITVRNRFNNKQYQQSIDIFIQNIIHNIKNYNIEDVNMED